MGRGEYNTQIISCMFLMREEKERPGRERYHCPDTLPGQGYAASPLGTGNLFALQAFLFYYPFFIQK